MKNTNLTIHWSKLDKRKILIRKQYLLKQPPDQFDLLADKKIGTNKASVVIQAFITIWKWFS